MSDDCNQVDLKYHFEQRLSDLERSFQSELKARDVALKLARDNARQTAILWATALSVVVGVVIRVIKW